MMRTLFLLSAVVLGAHSCMAAYVVNFDTPGQFAQEFVSSQSGPMVQSATGGLNNSGSVNLAGLAGGTQQVTTFNHPFSGALSSWSVSFSYKGNAENFWMLGVTTEAAPAIKDGTVAANDTYLPHIAIQSGSADGGSMNVSNYSPSMSEWTDSGNVVVVPGGITSAVNWYRYDLNFTYLGSSTFTVQGTMTLLNADGSVNHQMATVTQNYVNPEIANDPNAYLFFHLYDGAAVDNFTTTIIPESGSAALLAAFAGVACFRRPRRR